MAHIHVIPGTILNHRIFKIISDGCRKGSQNKLKNKTQVTKFLVLGKCVAKSSFLLAVFSQHTPNTKNFALHAQLLSYRVWLCHGPLSVALSTTKGLGAWVWPPGGATLGPICAPMVLAVFGHTTQ